MGESMIRQIENIPIIHRKKRRIPITLRALYAQAPAWRAQRRAVSPQDSHADPALGTVPCVYTISERASSGKWKSARRWGIVQR
jgi:hypothetical protein